MHLCVCVCIAGGAGDYLCSYGTRPEEPACGATTGPGVSDYIAHELLTLSNMFSLRIFTSITLSHRHTSYIISELSSAQCLSDCPVGDRVCMCVTATVWVCVGTVPMTVGP